MQASQLPYLIGVSAGPTHWTLLPLSVIFKSQPRCDVLIDSPPVLPWMATEQHAIGQRIRLGASISGVTASQIESVESKAELILHNGVQKDAHVIERFNLSAGLRHKLDGTLFPNGSDTEFEALAYYDSRFDRWYVPVFIPRWRRIQFVWP